MQDGSGEQPTLADILRVLRAQVEMTWAQTEAIVRQTEAIVRQTEAVDRFDTRVCESFEAQARLINEGPGHYSWEDGTEADVLTPEPCGSEDDEERTFWPEEEGAGDMGLVPLTSLEPSEQAAAEEPTSVPVAVGDMSERVASAGAAACDPVVGVIVKDESGGESAAAACEREVLTRASASSCGPECTSGMWRLTTQAAGAGCASVVEGLSGPSRGVGERRKRQEGPWGWPARQKRRKRHEGPGRWPASQTGAGQEPTVEGQETHSLRLGMEPPEEEAPPE
ncbi:hypothetical protein GWK47_002857 [Chionoecetes opilio]|uniref:Uncharacterized protein n=1 Tax=Chionoecetes opilio TaxID=41210 RepID=A0A8J4XPD4_CHIOP|nr:hypothetical protein GWK47_002857 [Chionoecetes opilio]